MNQPAKAPTGDRGKLLGIDIGKCQTARTVTKPLVEANRKASVVHQRLRNALNHF
jgi:hypothetical protein